MPSVVYRLSFTDFEGRSHEKFFSTSALAEAERTTVLEKLLVSVQGSAWLTRASALLNP